LSKELFELEGREILIRSGEWAVCHDPANLKFPTIDHLPCTNNIWAWWCQKDQRTPENKCNGCNEEIPSELLTLARLLMM